MERTARTFLCTGKRLFRTAFDDLGGAGEKVAFQEHAERPHVGVGRGCPPFLLVLSSLYWLHYRRKGVKCASLDSRPSEGPPCPPMPPPSP